MYRVLNKVNWYYYYYPEEGKVSLLDIHNEIEAIDGFLVSLTKDGFKLYTLFNNFQEFIRYNNNIINPANRSFFECILGDKKQRPKFDVDVEVSDDLVAFGDKILARLISSFRHFIPNINLEKDVLIFTSHSATKRSFHVIIRNYYHYDNIEAKAFYKAVMSKIDTKYSQHIDPAVYSKLQQFRIYGSQKEGSNRPKIQLLEFRGLNFEPVTSMEETFVTNTKGCKHLKFTRALTNNVKVEIEDLDMRLAENALNLINIPSLTISGVQGPVVMLKNNGGYYCKPCKRVHEFENPYLVVYPPVVYMNCRRYNSEGIGIKIGYLDIGLVKTVDNDTFEPYLETGESSSDEEATLEGVEDKPIKCSKVPKNNLDKLNNINITVKSRKDINLDMDDKLREFIKSL